MISESCRDSIKPQRMVSRRNLCCWMNSRYPTAAELGTVRSTELNIFHPEIEDRDCWGDCLGPTFRLE